MAEAPTDPLGELRAAVVSAAAGLDGDAGEKLSLERPPKAELGDYSTNAAMLLAPSLGGPPREIAERLRGALAGTLGDRAERIEVAGPGFLNLFLSDRWHRAATAERLARPRRRLRARAGRVRERQPDRAGDRGERARRRVRRLARSPARALRLRGLALVLPERRRHAGAPVRGVH